MFLLYTLNVFFGFLVWVLVGCCPGVQLFLWGRDFLWLVPERIWICLGIIKQMLSGETSARIKPASEAQAPRPDASDVVFPSSASPASGRHSQRRLRPDVTANLTHIPPPPHISCTSPPPYLASGRLFSCLASPQHPDASPWYPLFLLLPRVLITTCRRYHPSHSCRCPSYYYYYRA